jgi:hypothetical protein
VRESAVDSRFAAAHAAAGPIVGRERELAFLYDSWQSAVGGYGHMMLLLGEAGMGKSRLLEAFADRIRQEPSRILRCQCSPYHGNSALYPFERLLRHRLGVHRELTDQDNLDGIDRLLSRFDRHSRTARLLLAQLLGIRTAETLSPLEMTPTQRKEETLAVLEDLLLAPHEGPVLLLVEDMHWSDQSTQALFDRIVKRVGRAKALVVITHRPEFKTNWSGHHDATVINCKPIGHEHCEALIRQIASKHQIGASLIREIAARSDGMPLFAEELTKAVLELRSPDAGAVPLTLQDTLMARLDRLGRAKDIAQIAAVIARQFSLELLQAIAGSNETDLGAALTRLREAGLVFAAEGHDQSPICSFNHSLAQEGAYESLSRDRRQVFHQAIARFLESQPDAGADNDPALIAHHYGRAAEPEKSVHFWLLAADKSNQHLAFGDAIASLESAVAEAGRIPDPARRVRLQADAQLKLGTALAIYRGPQTSQAETALEEARRLAEEAGAGPQMFQATLGLYINAARTQRLDKAKLRGEQLLDISEKIGDEDLKLEALHHRWGYAYFIGRNPELIELSTEGVRRYDRDRHHRLSFVFASHDPGVCAHCAPAFGLAVAVVQRARGVHWSRSRALALAAASTGPGVLLCHFIHVGVCRRRRRQVSRVRRGPGASRHEVRISPHRRCQHVHVGRSARAAKGTRGCPPGDGAIVRGCRRLRILRRLSGRHHGQRARRCRPQRGSIVDGQLSHRQRGDASNWGLRVRVVAAAGELLLWQSAGQRPKPNVICARRSASHGNKAP